MGILHMETEVVYDVIRRLRHVMTEIGRLAAELNRLPPPSVWWQGGWTSAQFEQDLRAIQFGLRLITEKGWHLTGLLERELHEWEAVDAHFGDVGLWSQVAGFSALDRSLDSQLSQESGPLHEKTTPATS